MRSSPIQVGSGSYKIVALGNNSTMAIDPYGTLTAWGENLYGQAGTNSITSYSWTQLSNGDAHSLALRSDNTLWGWGLNTSGQLGTSDTIARQSPTQISANIGGVVTSNWSSVSAGASHSVAISNDGVAYGWGLNTSGQVGDVTVISRSSPVQIPVAGPSSNYSVYFDGTGDYLSIDANSAFDLSTSDFTVEFWVYFNGSNNSRGFFAAGNSSRSGIGYQISASGILQFIYGNGTTCTFVTGTNALQLNTWIHVATSRVGSNARVYINGTLEITVTSSNFGAGSYSCFVGIGYGISGGNLTLGSPILGYISNFRLIKGTALYTTGFYPSTGRFTTTSQNAIASQVSLLTAQSATIVDNSTNAFVITNNGPSTVSSSNPYGPYYSGSFTTTGQRLSVASNSAFDFGTGNFTLECWFYSTTVGTQVLIDRWNFGVSIFLLRLVGTSLQGWINASGVSNMGGGTVTANTWNHAAFVRNGSIFTLYLNGVSVGTPINTALALSTGTTVVSIGGNASETVVGYMSDVRIVKGTAVYTGNFTPPGNILRTTQSAMTNIVALTGTETVLLTLQNATIIDNSTNAFIITNTGSVLITTLFAPFIGSATEVLIANKVAAGNNFTLAIRNDNTLYSWGLNTSYQLGDGTTTSRNNPGQVGTSSWSLISAGGSHALAIDANNKLYGWGTQTFGQLGLGDTALRSQPTQIGASSWIAISAGYTHSMALTSDNRLFTWGINANGQLGFNRSFISLNAGYVISSVVRSDGTLWAWGQNAQGQLGDGTVVAKSSPVAVGLLTNWSKVTKSSVLNSFAIKTDGTLWGWGENSTGSIGDGTLTNKSSPVQIGASTWTIVATASTVTIGQQATYAITSDGKLYSWGFNNVGQLGLGDTTNRTSPVQVSVGTSWSLVTAGLQYALAITNNGALYSWGINNAGQLGDPTLATTTNRSTPTILSGSDSWSQVSAGASHVVGIKTNNTVFAWGFNTQGQLGDNTNVNKSSPVQVGTISTTLTDANAYSLQFNGSSSYLTIPYNTVFDIPGSTQWTFECWVYTVSSSVFVIAGRNWNYGGNGPTWAFSLNGGVTPIWNFGGTGSATYVLAVSTLSGTLGQWNHYAFTRDVSNDCRIFVNGQVGVTRNDSSAMTSASGAVYIGVSTNLGSSFANGYMSNLRIVKGQALYTSVFTPTTSSLTTSSQGATSANVSLLTAQNTTIIDNSTNIFTITNVGGVTYSLITPFTSAIAIGAIFATQISAGGTHSVAIDTSNKLFTWGLNSSGQLALNDIANRSAPVQVGFSSNWNNISAGDTHTIALDNAGTLYAWGLGTTGQLGDITAVSKSSPVLITSISIPNTSSPTQIGTSSYTIISAGNNFSTAISSDKKLFVWGLGAQGQLGAGLTVARSRPMQISVSNSYNLIGAGGTHLSIVPSTSPQLILTTGLNTSGQLGSLTVTTRSSPVQISASASSFNSPVTVSVGNYSSYYVSSPTQVGSSSWTSVSAGGTHTLGVRNNGLLYAWGYNANGQLADSTTINRSSPVQIGSSSWSQVSAGDLHNIILKSDGTINTFGLNSFGQLGDGT